MARSLVFVLFLAVSGCASAPPPRTVYVQQVVYVENRTPPPRVRAPYPPRKPHFRKPNAGRPHKHPHYHGPARGPHRTPLRARPLHERDTARR
jgi:hypothetical protein